MWTRIGLCFLLSTFTSADLKEKKNSCFCHTRYEDNGGYVDILSSPELKIEDCSKPLECTRVCRNLYESLGKGDLSYFVLKEKKTIGQMLCSVLAERSIMNVQNKTVELFSHVCEDPMEPANRESKGKDFCCMLGKYFNCLG